MLILNKDILKCILDVFVLRMGYELSHSDVTGKYPVVLPGDISETHL